MLDEALQAERTHLLVLARGYKALEIRESTRRCEESLFEFLRESWPSFDPSPFVGGWHLEAICEHLEAVSFGEIRKLLINIPPRHSKTNTVSIAWPAWTWARQRSKELPLLGPQVRFMTLTYGHQLSVDNATTHRRLVGAPWYQERWGKRVEIRKDKDSQEKFDTTAGGYRISSSIEGATLGRGGDIRIIDDANKVTEAESELEREKVNKTYDEAIRSRVTDPKITATVVIAQRLHERDLSGYLLETDNDFVHLCLPAEAESGRSCVTVLGWEDPRKKEGEAICPDRFGSAELKQFKSNPYSWSGQWQQRPEPRGGGIIKRDYWRIWDNYAQAANDCKPGTYPSFDYIIASFDGAFGQKQENDWSALTVWGTFVETSEEQRILEQFGTPGIMLIAAWRKKLTLHGKTDLIPLGGESKAEFEDRKKENWGLVEHIAETCRKLRVNKLLIEAKANGIDVANEIRRLYNREDWMVVLDDPGQMDKTARTYAVQHFFADGRIWAPGYDDGTFVEWAQMVVDELAQVPKGAHDDLADTSVAAIRHLRRMGLLVRADENASAIEELVYPSQPKKRIGYES